MFNNVIEQFHNYKVHFHFKFTVVACFSSIALEYSKWIWELSFFAQIIKRIKVRNVTIVMEEVHGINLLPCHALLLRWLLFSPYFFWSDFELNTLKCKPADDSKALILSCKKLVFSFYFLPSYGSIDDIFLNFTLNVFEFFFCFSFVFWKKSRKE
jgi:hypothetical protein